MKPHYLLIGLFTVLLINASCKRGCMDPKAVNYDLEASKDDGNCLYEIPTLTINIEPTYKGAPLELDKAIDYTDGRQAIFETMRFYLSNADLTLESGEKFRLFDLLLFDLDITDTVYSSSYTFEVPTASYSQLTLGLGVPEDLNATDPSTYEPTNPLSIYSQMYWGWTTKYIFAKVDGRYDDGNGLYNGAFFYHTGFDIYYQQIPSIQLDLPIGSGIDGEINITIDLHEVLDGAENPINLITEGQTHTSDNEDLAMKFLVNFSKALKLKVP